MRNLLWTSYIKEYNKTYMKKYGVVLVLILLIGTFWFLNKQDVVGLAQDFQTAQYEVDGEMITLGTNGVQYFGNETWGDFNNDGREDVAFLIVRNAGNNQNLYYATAAFNLEEGYEGMNAVFLGENISPQSIQYGDKIVVVNYGENTQTASIGTVGASTFLLISNSGLEKVGYQESKTEETQETPIETSDE